LTSVSSPRQESSSRSVRQPESVTRVSVSVVVPCFNESEAEIIAAGKLGEIILFENSFTGSVDMSGRWNSNPELSGGGVLIDNGTHSVDIMRYLLGPLAELRVIEGKRLQSPNVEDTVHIFVRSKEGVIGSIDLSWSMSKGLPTFINIFGSEGTLHVGWQESKYKLNGDDEWTQFGTGYNKVAAFANQLKNFAGAIRVGEPLVIGPDDALASVYTIEAAYQSMQESGWLPVESTDELYSKSIR
jgi:predicted dehydrogenase